MAGKADILLTARIVDEHGKEITDTYIRDNILTKLNKHTRDPLIRKTVPLSEALNAAENGPKGNIKTTKYHREKIDEFAKRVAESQATVVAEEADKANEAVSSSFEGMIDVVQQSVQAYLKSMTEAAEEVAEAVKEQVEQTAEAVSDVQEKVVENATGTKKRKPRRKRTPKKTDDTDNTTPEGTEQKPKEDAEPANTEGEKDKKEEDTTPKPKVVRKRKPKKEVQPDDTEDDDKEEEEEPPKPKVVRKRKPKKVTPPDDADDEEEEEEEEVEPPKKKRKRRRKTQKKSDDEDDDEYFEPLPKLDKEDVEDIFEPIEEFNPTIPQEILDIQKNSGTNPPPQRDLIPVEDDKDSGISDTISQKITRALLTAAKVVITYLVSSAKQGAEQVSGFINYTAKKFFLAPSKELFKIIKSIFHLALSASQIVNSILNIVVVPFVLTLEYLLVPVLKVIIPYITKFVKFISANKNEFLKLGEYIAEFLDTLLSAAHDTITKDKNLFASPISVLLDAATSMLNSATLWFKSKEPDIIKSLEDIIISGIEMLKSSARLSTVIFDAVLTAFKNVFAPENSKFVQDALKTILGSLIYIMSSIWVMIQENPIIHNTITKVVQYITWSIIKALFDAVSLAGIPFLSAIAGMISDKMNSTLENDTKWISEDAERYIREYESNRDSALSTSTSYDTSTINDYSSIVYMNGTRGLANGGSIYLDPAGYGRYMLTGAKF